jgi:hypothetical protein
MRGDERLKELSNILAAGMVRLQLKAATKADNQANDEFPGSRSIPLQRQNAPYER